MVNQIINNPWHTTPKDQSEKASSEAYGFKYVEISIIPIVNVGKTLATTGFSSSFTTPLVFVISFIVNKIKIMIDIPPNTFLYNSPYDDTKLPVAARASISPAMGIGNFFVKFFILNSIINQYF
jgi:hypothetical protein